MAADTPKYWKQYLEALEKNYQHRFVEWAKAKARLEIQLDERPWWKKAWNDGHWEMFYMQMREPEPIEPTIVGYYNWETKERRHRNV